MAAALDEPYDVIVLDQRLALLNGRHLAHSLRDRRVHTPILLLADSEAVAKVEGVDDHLVRPFSQRELIARLCTLDRRRATDRSRTLRAGGIQLDPVAQVVQVGDRRLDLTSKEFAILEHLMLNNGRVLARAAIVRHVWNYEFEGSRTLVEVHIGNLRRKLAAVGAAGPIVTVRGAGYRFDP
jgi:two-component system, OmpR family, response regulator